MHTGGGFGGNLEAVRVLLQEMEPKESTSGGGEEKSCGFVVFFIRHLFLCIPYGVMESKGGNGGFNLVLASLDWIST